MVILLGVDYLHNNYKKYTDMQFSRILLDLITRHITVLICVVFILINGMFYSAAKHDHVSQINAQLQYTQQIIELALPLEIIKPLSPVILEWQLINTAGYTQKRKIFGKSWNAASTKLQVSGGHIYLVHKSMLSAYFIQFFIVNLILFLTIFIILIVAHLNLHKHWKVLIQLEAWANRYDKNEDFKFYLTNKSYNLVNTIRNVIQAKNEAQKSGNKADHYIRSQTFLDNHTGLGNRLYFEHRLDSVLQEEDKVYGAVLIIQFEMLDSIRDRDGKHAVALILQQYSEILKQYVDDTAQSVVSRISPNDFAILLPYVDGNEVERIALSILRMSQKVKLPDYIDTNVICHIGVDMYDREDTTFKILAEADMALRAAQLHGPSGWFMYDSGQLPASEIKGSVRWRTAIQSALDNDDFVLLFQPVIGVDMRVHHHEVLARMQGSDDELINAKVFFPMAKKCGLIPLIDRQVLLSVVDAMEKGNLTPISINIHIDSWLNKDFCNWLIEFLKVNTELAKYFIFEISEFELAQNAKQLSSMFAAVRRFQVQFMIDQVGLYVLDTGYLDYLDVNYLKLHQSLVNQIQARPENQMFIRSLQNVVADKKIMLFATGVESEQEITTLERLGINGVQGHFVKRPSEKIESENKAINIDGDSLDL
jgi:RNase E specificity factor CsrD